ncbi:phytase [Nonomuraea jiangxiensis]|uniref:3-phytase n=1 Tax=Nonomuraea jiangxiensis TaxID=633440 RepID=A0A1G9TJ93_9ACTN|nr:phytase [Nonomuraea jiangxiensis]SDM47787.1 3-phytase [Nonomuraea jiangxiensis]
MRPSVTTATLAAVLCLAGTVAAPAAASDTLPGISPEVETPALFDDEAGGNANGDDPAIWVHPAKPGGSVVVATAKDNGLYVYSLDGAQLQHVPAPAAPGEDDEPGRFNNVDLVYGFRLSTGAKVDLAVVSDRGRDHIRFYAIDPARAAAGRAPLTDVTDPAVPHVFNDSQEEVNEARTAYGLATWRDQVLVSRRHSTSLGLLKMVAAPSGKVSYQRVRTLDLPESFTLPGGATWTPCLEPGEQPQVEGMVVDGERGVLYAAQEDVGIWRMRADLTGSPALVDKVREYGRPGVYDPETEECALGPDQGLGGRHLSADAEGLTIYHGAHGKGYLLASSQGDDTFAVYQRDGGNAYLGGFRVTPGNGLDGTQASDGAMVVNVPLGRRYPQGLFVTHDGANTPEATGEDGEVRENTDFKFVRWDHIAGPLGLTVDTRSGNPRG